MQDRVGVEMAETSDRLTAEQSSADQYEVGVLFVHGIGRQQPSETLITFGDPLTHYLHHRSELTCAKLASASGRRPAHANLEVKLFDRDHKPRPSAWLLAEGYWADTILSPTFGSLVRWCFAILPWTVLAYLQESVPTQGTRSRSVTPAAARVPMFGIVLIVISTLIGFLVAPLLFALLALLLIIGSLPFTALKDFAAGLQRLLASTLGDSMILLDSPIQRAAILERVHSSYQWLERRCTHVAVVAHSQGAAIAHEMLRERECPKVKLLVTFGSGLRKLTQIREFSDKGSGILWTAATCSLAAVGLLYQMIGRAGISALVPVAAVLGLCLLLFAIHEKVAHPIEKVWRWYRGEQGFFEELGDALVIAISTFVVGAILYLVAAWLVGDLVFGQSGLTWNVLLVCFAASVLLVIMALPTAGGGYIGERLNPTEREQRRFEERFKLRDTLRWVDIYSSSDPVPNGPLMSSPPAGAPSFVSVEVQNRASVILDHTAYWHNYEQFVSRIASELLELSKREGDELPDSKYYAERATERDGRVAVLRRWRIVAVASVVALAWIRWDWLLAYARTAWPPVMTALKRLPVAGDLLGAPATSASAGADLLGAGFLACIAALVAYVMTSLLWIIWDGGASKRFSSGSPGGSASKYVFYILPAACVALTLWQIVNAYIFRIL